MFLIDTDVLIWYLRGNTKAKTVVEHQESFFISVVTYMELVQGMRNKKELAVLRSTLRQWGVKILYLNEEISVKAMFFVEHHYLSHSLQLADALIAATAFANGLTVLTADTKHYEVISDIEVAIFKP
ncbi:MAG: type II toxin-antitoxin system VapC family toxin [Bacteroidota bacterium]